MNLYKKTYVGNKWRKKGEQVSVSVPEKKKEKAEKEMGDNWNEHILNEVREIKSERITEIVEDMGYWRKANAIHNWIIDNVADGVDDCKEVYFSEEDMKELLDICKKVLAKSKMKKGEIQVGTQYKDGKETPMMEDGEYVEDSSVAEELLPTASGFFFGGTEYDQYYIEDVKHTVEVLETALKESGDYYYSASW